MPQSSAPIVGENLSDTAWRDLFGDEAGVVGDLDGTAYKVTLPTDSEIVQVGSATQRSLSRVAGFAHRIPAGETESLTIPAATGSARTDIIAARYDPSFTGDPGPVRLVRVVGSSSGLPSYDDAAPGVEDLPLWSITRQPGQALSAAAVQRLFPRLAPALDVAVGAPLPTSSPLGTIAYQGGITYRRVLGEASVPVWDRVGAGVHGLLHGSGTQAVGSGVMSTIQVSTVVRAVGLGTVASGGRLVAVIPGPYLVSGMASFSVNGSGRRLAQIFRNGVGIPQTLSSSAPNGTANWRVPTATYPVDLAAGDYLHVAGFQDSGSTLSFARSECFLQATYIG